MKKLINAINNAMFAFASVRAVFLFAICGVIAQTYHTYYLGYDISLIPGIHRVIQGIFMTLLFSGGLIVYTLRAGNAETLMEKERYDDIANYFKYFEIWLNLFYWSYKIIYISGWHYADGHRNVESFDWNAPEYFRLIVAIPFAIALPVIIKQFAGEIKLKDVNNELNSTELYKAQVLEEVKQYRKENEEMRDVINDYGKSIESLSETLGGEMKTDISMGPDGKYTVRLRPFVKESEKKTEPVA